MDREKVIKALEYCVLSDDCRPCEYWMEFDDTGCQIMKDALALLKEQELTKAKPRPEKLLPCKCGCKRREHWFGTTSERAEILKCCKCGFEAAGKNEIDAHAKWNKAVRGETDA